MQTLRIPMPQPLGGCTRITGLAAAMALTVGLLAPFTASAEPRHAGSASVKAALVSVGHADRQARFEHRFVGRQGRNRGYFVRPHKPLNFKHWLRVERRLHHYTPHSNHLNRYELRQVLGHGYDRYLRDHRRWSRRAQRQLAHQDYRSLGRRHDARYCRDRSHRHQRRDRRSRW